MTIAELFTSGGLTLLGVIIMALALGSIIGSWAGGLNERSRQHHERSRAWRRGVYAGMEWEARSRVPGAVVELPRDPYSGNTLAPMPPRYVMASPPRATLFDQDAPTEAGRAIELRGDD